MRVPASDWMERSALRRRRALRSAAGALNCNDTSDALGSGAEEAQYLSSLGAPTSGSPVGERQSLYCSPSRSVYRSENQLQIGRPWPDQTPSSPTLPPSPTPGRLPAGYGDGRPRRASLRCGSHSSAGPPARGRAAGGLSPPPLPAAHSPTKGLLPCGSLVASCDSSPLRITSRG
jgi:hypothetical protein